MIKGLTRWIIDQARSHAASVGASKPVESQSTEQDRIQYRPTTFRFYFAACIFTRCPKKLRLETGEETVTSAAVRTVIPSRIIRQYQKC